MIWQIVTDPDLVALVRRAYTQGVVMDTWMHGEWQAQITPEAQIHLGEVATEFATPVSITQATGPVYPVSTQYLIHLFQAVLTSMALFRVHTQSDTMGWGSAMSNKLGSLCNNSLPRSLGACMR